MIRLNTQLAHSNYDEHTIDRLHDTRKVQEEEQHPKQENIYSDLLRFAYDPKKLLPKAEDDLVVQQVPYQT